MAQELKDTVYFLYKLIADQKNRLEYGNRDRERIKIQLANNQHPTGYRVDWILKSSSKIIILLGELGKEFNNMYPEDKISTDDLLDVLTTTMRKIQKFSKKSEDED